MTMNAELVLTATERLARELRADHSLAQRQAGHRAWEALPARSLHQWVLEAWLSTWPAEQLLHPAQELALWRSAVEEDPRAAHLLSPLSAARAARRADQLAVRYGMQWSDSLGLTEEQRAFLRWRRKVRSQLQREGWLTAAELAEAVARALRDGRLPAPTAVRLCGFVDPLPASEQSLMDALAGTGVPIERQDPVSCAQVERLCFPDQEAQLRHVALAIADRLRPFREAEGVLPRIVIVVQDADVLRDRLEVVFRPLLAPWLNGVAGNRACPWRWETGRPLTAFPWVDTAMALLELRWQNNPPERLARILLAPALWSPEQRSPAAALDYALRNLGRPRLRWSTVRQHAPAELTEPLEAFTRILEQTPVRALPSAWLEHFHARLQVIGWPGRSLSSTGFQVQREWERVLGQFATMDRQLGAIDHGEALAWLGELLRGRRFEARVEHEEPILIVSPEDSLGLRCDHLFLLDATVDQFPGPAVFPPFLPREVLMAAGVPQSTPELHLDQARRRVAHWLALAPQVTVCAPLESPQGGEALPSALFGAPSEWRPAPQHVWAPAAAVQLEWPDRDEVPPVRDPDAEGIRGGVSLFRDFADQPFFAFCHHRLGIQSFPGRSHGLDARAQGNAVHDVLERLWADLGDSGALAQATAEDLRAQAEAAVAAALGRYMPDADFGRALLQLERARIVDLVCQWLAHERRRVEPFRVLLREQQVEAAVGGLRLRLRVDRVDEVQTQQGPRFLVMDYKTGAEADPRGWDADRLHEPQLPLYASAGVLDAAGIPQVNGICFGHLRDGHPALVAWTDWRGLLIEPAARQFKEDWTGLLALWRARLERIAQGFLAGEAQLDASAAEARGPHADLLAFAERGR